MAVRARPVAALVGFVALALSGCVTPGELESMVMKVRLREHPTEGRITVESAPEGADWTGLSITASRVVVKFRLNGEASTQSAEGPIATAGSYVRIHESSKPVKITDFLDLCGSPTDGSAFVAPTITVVSHESNKKIGEFSIFALDAC